MYLAGKNTRGMGKKWAAGSDEAVTDAGHQGDWGWRIWAHKGNNRVIDSYERRPVNPVGGGQMHERCLVDITNTRLFPVGRIGLAQQQATTTLRYSGVQRAVPQTLSNAGLRVFSQNS